MTHLPRILLAEDSPEDSELILEALREFRIGNEVLHVKDGAEALDYLYRRGAFADYGQGQPAVIMLDIKMPRLDGIEVLKRVKGDPELKRIPVVIMTSSREEQDLLNSYNLGASAYVVKPLKFSELMEAVKTLGAFWAIINEPPPGSLTRVESEIS
jgi:two-component system, response regulator